jgi:hypothetical protein
LGAGVVPAATPYAITVHTGAVLAREPATEADAQATVRDLLALGADFEAGPLAINGRDFAADGVTPATVFDACTLAHVEAAPAPVPMSGAPTVLKVAALLRRAFDARITDTLRPTNASYGALHSWHKVGQAVDFVPSAGVMSINRDEIRALMASNGIRLLELLGPGDRGHANHWHVAFAHPGQVIDGIRPIEGDENWMVNVASAGDHANHTNYAPYAASASAPPPAKEAPPQWDVFAAQDWRAAHGSGS